MPNKNKLIAITIVLIILVAGTGYWYLSVYKPKELMLVFQKDYAKAHALHDAGKRDESIPAFQKALMEAPTKRDETQTKFQIAFDLFMRNQGDDRAQSAAMYKEIINDSSVLSIQRAFAIGEFMSLYNSSQDSKFAREVIFKGDPLGKFLDEARLSGYLINDDSDIMYAVRKSYEFSETFYPLSLSEFYIANWYSIALENGWYKNDAQKQEFISQLKEWTQKGESNLSFTLSVGYEKSKIGSIYRSNALDRKTLAKYTDQDYSYAENLFKMGLQALLPKDTPGDNDFSINAYNIGLYLRFNYAAMLANVYGDKRKNDIIALLQLIINPAPTLKDSSLSFYEFLRNETAKSHDTYGHKKDILRLTNLVPGFKEALAERGIVY